MLDTMLATAITLLCVADVALLVEMTRREARDRQAADAADAVTRAGLGVRSG